MSERTISGRGPVPAGGGGVILHADCLEAMREMDEASVDAIVTDPPAGISFMGREWDSDRSGGFIDWLAEVMAEALRVTKPGGHALVWALPRTSHWTGMACEKAGWEIRDRIAHHFGSGFPKSLGVSKAIDKAAGAEREVVGVYESPEGTSGRSDGSGVERMAGKGIGGLNEITAPATPEAAQWQGWGTALKPATEDWWLCRKPLIGTVSRNVQEFGTGALNIDATRIEGVKPVVAPIESENRNHPILHTKSASGTGEMTTAGRWPANCVLSHSDGCEPVGTRRVKSQSPSVPQPDFTQVSARATRLDAYARSGEMSAGHADPDGTEQVAAWRCVEGCPVAMLDEQSGERTSGSGQVAGERRDDEAGWRFRQGNGYGDTGGASRFFYTAKSSRSERNAGLEGFEERPDKAVESSHSTVCAKCKRQRVNVSGACECADPDWIRVQQRPAANGHPTVKPIALMRWLVRLITPPGGRVLDPFLGSGTTGAACVLEGFDFIGIEREAEYVAIAEARIAWWSEHQGREAEEVLADSRRSEVEREKHEASGQMELMEPAA